MTFREALRDQWVHTLFMSDSNVGQLWTEIFPGPLWDFNVSEPGAIRTAPQENDIFRCRAFQRRESDLCDCKDDPQCGSGNQTRKSQRRAGKGDSPDIGGIARVARVHFCHEGAERTLSCWRT